MPTLEVPPLGTDASLVLVETSLDVPHGPPVLESLRETERSEKLGKIMLTSQTNTIFTYTCRSEEPEDPETN